MERYETENYILEYSEEEKAILLHVLNRWIRLKLRTPMLISHDGETWIKLGGGKALTTEDIKTIFDIPEEQIQAIKQKIKSP